LDLRWSEMGCPSLSHVSSQPVDLRPRTGLFLTHFISPQRYGISPSRSLGVCHRSLTRLFYRKASCSIVGAVYSGNDLHHTFCITTTAFCSISRGAIFSNSFFFVIARGPARSVVCLFRICVVHLRRSQSPHSPGRRRVQLGVVYNTTTWTPHKSTHSTSQPNRACHPSKSSLPIIGFHSRAKIRPTPLPLELTVSPSNNPMSASLDDTTEERFLRS
jgi:hypothetical protein